MIPRIRLIITALLVCHLFLMPGAVNQPVASYGAAAKSSPIECITASFSEPKFLDRR